MSSSPVKRAYLLGPYAGNTHISIDNYFDYCRQSLASRLKDVEFIALKPATFGEGKFLESDVPRIQAWREFYFDWPRQLRKLEADLFHIVDQGNAWYRIFLPSGRRRSKTIVTVHDLINLLNMRGRMAIQSMPRRRHMLVNLCMRQIQKSDAVICPSTSTASDVMRELEMPASRISVIHNVISSTFQPLEEPQRAASRKRFFGDTGYAVLHVGKPTAYKNRVGVLKTFQLIHQTLPDSKLVMTSHELTADELAFLKDRPCAAAISICQPSDQQGLRELYSSADVFVFPSIFEGFGWPPIEAMACGCPVVSSTGGSLAEVIGDGAVRIDDPYNAQAFSNAAIEVLKDSRAAAQLRVKGLANSLRFSEATLGPQLAELYTALVN